MPGRLETWPAWPEYTAEAGEQGEDLVEYKKSIVEQYGKENIINSWLKVCKELETITLNIADQGTAAIPELRYEDVFHLDVDGKQKLKDVGCFVVRDVYPRSQADQWFQDLKSYVAANKDQVKGWPETSPAIFRLYFSPTQMAARSHPNQLKLSRELNSWWHDDSNSSSPEPLSYADAVRIRPPGVPFVGLGPHIDAGSLSRWADPTYQSFYSAVFSGHPEAFDNYDLTTRKAAKQALFAGAAHSRVFRSFQGWTALTSAGPGEGSLMLYPNVKWTSAYLMLRPFFRAPPSEDDIMDAAKWTFDVDSPWFPGTFREHSQALSLSSHPHLRLRDCMVHIPHMNPGDTVWWHADMCHAVEVDHNGDHEASVAYIAATPSTDENRKYIKGQLDDFLAGIPPEDFRGGSSERDFRLFTGEKGILSGDDGRRAMGFDLITV